MLTTLKTACTDTRADDLAWALGREPLPALAVLNLHFDDAEVQLRLLGASHQVLVQEERGSCPETVACIPGSRTPFPLGVAERIGDGGRSPPSPRVLCRPQARDLLHGGPGDGRPLGAGYPAGRCRPAGRVAFPSPLPR